MRRRLILALAAAALAWAPLLAEARCQPEMVRRDAPAPRAQLAAFGAAGEGAARTLSLEWFGHSFFRLVSPGGTRVLMDPFGEQMGLPVPAVAPDAITVGREHPHHNSVEIARGTPKVFRGLRDEGLEWSEVRGTVGDVLIYNVPVTQRTYGARTKGSAFVFQMGRLCVAHLGDVAEALTPSQIRRLGKIHIALVPIGGTFTVDPEGAIEIVRSLRPHIVIPMHYWDDEERLNRFLQGARHIRRLGKSPLRVNRANLPPPTQFVVMEHP